MTSQHHRFGDADWPDIVRRLTFEALRLFQTARLFGPDAVMKGVGVSPADLVYDTVSKLLSDDLRYRKDKGPLLPFLKLALKRDFLDLLKRSAYKTTDIFEPAEGVAKDPEAPPGSLDSLPSDRPAASDFILRKRIMERVEGDQGLVDFVTAALELGVTKTGDLADLLSTTTEDVQNRRKRLVRALEREPSLREGVIPDGKAR